MHHHPDGEAWCANGMYTPRQFHRRERRVSHSLPFSACFLSLSILTHFKTRRFPFVVTIELEVTE